MNSGIYVIKHTESGKVYIGSSRNIAIRWSAHRSSLRSGTHHSFLLQRSWDKYGEKAFTFEILELASVDQIRQREQFYLDKFECYLPKFGFNRCPKVNTTAGISYSDEDLIKKLKLTEQEISKVYELRSLKEPVSVIAKRFSVSVYTIYRYLKKNAKGLKTIIPEFVPEDSRKQISKEGIDLVLLLYKEGKPSKEISETVGVSEGSVHHILKHRGFERPFRPGNSLSIIKPLFDAGKTKEEISELTGFCEGNIYKVLRELGIEKPFGLWLDDTKIIELYKTGSLLKEIIDELKCSRGSVYNILKKADFTIPFFNTRGKNMFCSK